MNDFFFLFFRTRISPANEILLVLDGLAQRLSQLQLDKILQLLVDVPANGVREHRLHAGHQHLQVDVGQVGVANLNLAHVPPPPYLQPLDHGDNLDEGEFFLRRIVVPCRL